MSFDGRLLAGVSVLAAVVEGASFVRAADALGITPSGVSRAVSRLEARVGVRLLDRTTRSVMLTDEGRRFYEQVGPLLAGIEEAATTAKGSSHAVRGRLRVDIDPFFCRLMLAGHVGAFLAAHPELSLELITRERVGDLVADGVDVAIRFGEQESATLIARKLLDTRILTVAAPGYLKRVGAPRQPADLAKHNCIQFLNPVSGRPFDWEFRRGRKVVSVKTTGRLALTDVGTMHSECAAGTGVAQVMALGVKDLVQRGKLVELFPDWNGELFPLYALHPSKHLPPAKVRAFIDFVLKSVGASPAA